MRFFLDIGTHYGEGLSEFAHKLGLQSGWSVLCFEPNPLTKTDLGVKEVTKDWTSPVSLYRMAVWNETGKVNFLCSKRDPGELEDYYTSRWSTSYNDPLTRDNGLMDGVSSHIDGVRQNTWGGDTIEIDAISGNDILKMLNLKDTDEVYIKIDAEGAEKEIVESFLNSELVNFIKDLYCEVHEGISTSNVSTSVINSLCENKNVRFYSWY
jgi:FkbM family methyltransferase